MLACVDTLTGGETMNRHARRAEIKRRVETARAVQSAQRKRHAGVFIAGRWHPLAPAASIAPQTTTVQATDGPMLVEAPT